MGTQQIITPASNLAKRFEGLKLKAYHDPVGYPTQGYGRLLSRVKWEDLSKYPDITLEIAEDWLKIDLIKSLKSTLRLLPVSLTDSQLAALTDFSFNLGAGQLQISRLRKEILQANHDEAARQFLRWVYAGGKPLKGLVLRRQAEAQLFLTSS